MSSQRQPLELPRSLVALSAYSWRFLTVVAAAAVLVYVLVTLRLIVLPVFIALLISTLLAPAAHALRRRGLPALLATWVVILTSFAVMGGGLYLIAPEVGDELDDLGRQVKAGTEDVLTWLAQGPLDVSRTEVDGYVDQLSEELANRRGSFVTGAVKGAYLLVEIVTGFLLTIVLVFFFVKDGDRIGSGLLGLFDERRRGDVREIGTRSWHALTMYIRGTAIVGLVDALAIGIALLVLGVPLVVPLALITFFGAFFPLVGAVTAGLLASLVALVTQGVAAAAILAIVTVIVQQVEGDVLQPLVLGRAIDLHPLVILLSLTTGAIVAGIAGAFLAVPVAAVAIIVIRQVRSKGSAPVDVRS